MASNYPEGHKWWAKEVLRRFQESVDKDEDQQNDRVQVDNGYLFVVMASASYGQGARGRRWRARDELVDDSDDIEERADRAATRTCGRVTRGARGTRGGRGNGRARGRGRGVRTAPCAIVSSSTSSSPPPPLSRSRRDTTNASMTEDEEKTDHVFTLGDGRRSERPPTPMDAQMTPFTPVEAAAEAAAEMMSAAVHRADSKDNNADQIATDREEDLEQEGRTRRGRATAHGKLPPLPTRRRRARTGIIAHEGSTTDADY